MKHFLMRIILMVTGLALAGLSCSRSPEIEYDQAALKAEAIGLVKAFGGQLKPELLAAIEAGGPVNAIAVCAERAPAIARELSETSGWEVERVSLKPRNPYSGVSDAWEQATLQKFEESLRSGKPAEELARAEVVEGEFRFMKAQMVEPICLTCHGENLAPEVTQALARHYPGDQATGYKLGDMRGAFSLKRKL